jgi:hypothetical protein
LVSQGRDALYRLALAQGLGDTSKEKAFYAHLARISIGLRDVKKAEQYKRWNRELETSDGLSDKERDRQYREFAKAMAPLARASGNEEIAKVFEQESKPFRKKKNEN